MGAHQCDCHADATGPVVTVTSQRDDLFEPIMALTDAVPGL
jgi:hypothetical protein